MSQDQVAEVDMDESELEDLQGEDLPEGAEDDVALTPVQELLSAVMDGNAVRVQETFNFLVLDRIQRLVEDRKQAVAAALFMGEDVEATEEAETEEGEDE